MAFVVIVVIRDFPLPFTCALNSGRLIAGRERIATRRASRVRFRPACAKLSLIAINAPSFLIKRRQKRYDPSGPSAARRE